MNTTDFIYDVIKDVPQHQMNDSDAMNALAGTVFGAASIVLGLAVAGGASLNRGATALLLTALLPYLIVVLSCFSIIRVHKFHDVVDPKWLWDECKNDSVDAIKAMLAKHIPERVKVNQTHLHQKGVAFNWALAGLTLETLLIVVAVAVSQV